MLDIKKHSFDPDDEKGAADFFANYYYDGIDVDPIINLWKEFIKHGKCFEHPKVCGECAHCKSVELSKK